MLTWNKRKGKQGATTVQITPSKPVGTVTYGSKCEELTYKGRTIDPKEGTNSNNRLTTFSIKSETLALN